MICEHCETVFIYAPPEAPTGAVLASCPACHEPQSATPKRGSIQEAVLTFVAEFVDVWERRHPRVTRS